MADQVDDMTTRARDGRGRFDRDPNTAQRDADAARLRARSLSYSQIGAELGISRQAAYEAVKRALADTLTEPAEQVRALELEKLDAAERAVLAVLEREHLTVQHGRVVRLDDGSPVADDAPVLQAVDRLLKIAARRAALLGLDSPKKLDVTGDVKYELVGISPEDLV